MRAQTLLLEPICSFRLLFLRFNLNYSAEWVTILRVLLSNGNFLCQTGLFLGQTTLILMFLIWNMLWIQKNNAEQISLQTWNYSKLSNSIFSDYLSEHKHILQFWALNQIWLLLHLFQCSAFIMLAIIDVLTWEQS